MTLAKILIVSVGVFAFTWAATVMAQMDIPTPTTTSSLDWERILLQYGPLYVLFGVFIWFVLRYGPGLIEAQKDMMRSVSESSKSAAASAKVAVRGLVGMELVLRHAISAAIKLLPDHHPALIELKKAERILDERDKDSDE